MIYIAGKITEVKPKDEALNKQRFYDTEARFKALDIEVFNPVRHEPPNQTWENYLAQDLETLFSDKITGAYFMTEWRESLGARLEHEAALRRRLKDKNFKIIYE